MLSIDVVSDLIDKNKWYFSNTDAASLFEFTDYNANAASPFFTKISEDVFALKRLPSTKLDDKKLETISQPLLTSYGLDIFPSMKFADILAGIISKNETLIRWVKSKYEKNDKYGLYILQFRDPLKVPLPVKTFVMKALVVVQTMSNETNKGNLNIPKTLLKGIKNES